MTSAPRTAIHAAALTALALLAGCGQRGPLTLPEPGTAPPAAETPSDSDSDRDDDER